MINFRGKIFYHENLSTHVCLYTASSKIASYPGSFSCSPKSLVSTVLIGLHFCRHSGKIEHVCYVRALVVTSSPLATRYTSSLDTADILQHRARSVLQSTIALKPAFLLRTVFSATEDTPFNKIAPCPRSFLPLITRMH